MRAILIDPFAKSVSEIDIDKANVLQDLYRNMQCDLVDVVRYENVDVWVDDEGLMKPNQKFFLLTGGHQPLAGRAIIMESNEEGESTATTISVREVYNFTMFQAD